MDIEEALTLALLLAAAPAFADKPMGAVPGESFSLGEPARTAAVHVQRANHEAVLAAFSPLVLEGVEHAEPFRPARCEVNVRLDPAALPPGSIVDGLPVRRAQPLLFNQFQKQVVAGVEACRKKIAFTPATIVGLRDRSLDLLVALSGATYCRQDADCHALRADPGACGGRAPVTLAGSETTDYVFFVAFRKFMPGLVSRVSATAKASWCPRPLWAETPLEAACVRSVCRPLTGR
jgi:hypothetical protein